MKIIACYSSKGGVGKTSAAVNLAYASAKHGLKTLLIDLDQQGASTFYFRVRPEKAQPSKTIIRSLVQKRDATKEIRETDFELLHILPANQAFRNLDSLLDGIKKSKRRLADFIEDLGSSYDRVILDCPPTLSLMAENVFRTSDIVLIPVVPTTLSERTLSQLTEFFKEADFKKKKLRPFFSMVEKRKRIHSDTMSRLRLSEKRMLRSSIPYSAEIESMGTHRAPVLQFSPAHPSSQAFRELWMEVESLLKP
ncbi:ParA family protein [Haloferula chungangensis]|uniref:ParA family protein n=1 Tax=Haloferula chungangensis TaxID=1048331 RepID=A0ABW2LAQ2_9BACT